MSQVIYSLLLFAVFALAYANGSNDISKGIATLVGSGVSDYRKAILWGTGWTVAGALLAAWFSKAMVLTFSKGIIDPRFHVSDQFLVAALIGAVGWVWFASKKGLPVSTTHAITGALCGAAVVASGWQGILWTSVFQKIVIPLLVSPLVAFVAMGVFFPFLRVLLAPLSRACACADLQPLQSVASLPGGGFYTSGTASQFRLVVNHVEACQTRGTVFFGIKGDDLLHWVSSGLTSFARGLNDTPKIVALGLPLVLISKSDPAWLFVWGALGVGLGSLVAGTRVTETLAEKITKMSAVEGLSANLITSFLVTVASRWGIPVSTTHVSSGAIIGLGLHRCHGEVRWATMVSMVRAWIITLPAGAGLAAASLWAIQKIL